MRPRRTTSPQSVGTRLAAFLRRFVRLRSAHEPVVLLLDDAHWLDRRVTSRAGGRGHRVRDHADAPPSRTFDPSTGRPWIGGSHYQQTRASLHSAKEPAASWYRTCFGSDVSIGEVSDLIREPHRGNPFFTEEVVHRAGGVRGSLIGERGAYRLMAPGRYTSPSLPETGAVTPGRALSIGSTSTPSTCGRPRR
jgi:hypothetical protein